MGVITSSGFLSEDLRSGPTSWTDLLDVTDLLVDGPYEASSRETERALVGSTNQRFIHLTQRYEKHDPSGMPNRVEVRVDTTGVTNVAGFLERPSLWRLTRPDA
jgi:anaerobic ribonucleoside-triphosphate reductase activating protein